MFDFCIFLFVWIKRIYYYNTCNIKTGDVMNFWQKSNIWGFFGFPLNNSPIRASNSFSFDFDHKKRKTDTYGFWLDSISRHFIKFCNDICTYILQVIDADGLYLVSKKPEILQNYSAPVILTPNVMEFRRLVGESSGDGSKLDKASIFLKKLNSDITIFCKDHIDEILSNGTTLKVQGGGSGRRCGGQGDLLGGSLATFFAWAIMNEIDINVACYAASRLTRECNARAFAKYGRSMTTTDMLHEIGGVFRDHFETK